MRRSPRGGAAGRRRSAVEAGAALAAAIAACGLLLAACASGPGATRTGAGIAARTPGRPGPASGARPGPGGGAAAASPERAVLAGLPEPAAGFALEYLARVAAGDWAWVSAAAETAFVRAWGLPPGPAGSSGAARPSGAVYGPELLARLVRAERAAPAAASGAPPAFSGDEGGPARVEPRLVRRAVYVAARTEGPAALVSGRLELEGGGSQAFELRILYRLTPPRLAGELP